jgi:BASS family bile acid:Na+ symporter
VTLPISTIASFVGISILTPLIVGVVVGALWPRAVNNAARILTIVAYVVLIPIVVLIIGASASKIGALLGDGTLAVIILTVLSALAAGYWLGGPKAQHRLALGQAAATRHPGIAALIIKRNFDDPRVMLAVVLFLLVSVVVTLVYQAVLLKRIRGGEAAGGERPCETS